MAALREAIEAGETVLIGYVDNQGASSERLVDPIRVEGGSSPRTTTAATTSAPSPCTGSRRSAR